MAADHDSDRSPPGPDPNRFHRVRYLSEAASAAIDQGKEEVAESNLNEALSEIRSYRGDIEAVLIDENIDPSREEELESAIENLHDLEENIEKQLKVI